MFNLSLDLIRIVLVEPAGPLNVGSVARVMKNMGLSQLVLVNPQCDFLGKEARQMAVHAADVLERSQVVETLPDALVSCRRAIATTGRDRITLPLALESPRAGLPWLLEGTNHGETTALIFGREDSGLTTAELNYAHRLLQIPTSPLYSSLNLAQAVAICCYELHESACTMANAANQNAKTRDAKRLYAIAKEQEKHVMSVSTGCNSEASELTVSAPTAVSLATLDTLEGFYQQLEELLLSIGYLYPHTATSRMQKFRRFFNRAYPSDPEVAMLRGILTQMKWALGVKQSPHP